MQRAIAAAILAGDKLEIKNPTYCGDAEAALKIAENFGFEVERGEKEVKIKKTSDGTTYSLNCGESGLAIRMFAPIAALLDTEVELRGEGSLKTRPLSMIEEPLRQLGVEVSTNDGLLPVKIKGPMKGGEVHVDGSVSSQFLSGLLMALPKCENDSKVIVKNLVSKPYIDMTLSVLESFGVHIENDNYEVFNIKGGQEFHLSKYKVEGDWSSAAFFFVAAAINEFVEVKGLQIDSKQGDMRILDAIENAGAYVEKNARSIIVKNNQLSSFAFDASDCPDLFPPLAVLACATHGKSVIQGVERLKHKESDRAQVLVSELNRIGANITIAGNNMIIKGTMLRGGDFSSHNDHRIAMAGAIASLMSVNKVEIDDVSCIDKSYPGFFEHYVKIGGRVDE
jgi:3-phosphoshikimate 1-carboxyvinyltransferase